MEYLALTVLGKNQLGISNELTKLVHSCDCNITDCRMMILGAEFSANLLVSGTWNAIAKLESMLPAFETKHELHSLLQRTKAAEPQTDIVPYSAYVLAHDEVGIIYQLTNFFAELGLYINELTSECYNARYSQVPICTVTISISVPTNMSISDLREQFMLFCERYNFDGIIEPEKA